MSTTAETTGETAQTAADLTPKQRRISDYLRAETDPGACTYFKSRLIAENLGLSAKEVGANMAAVDAAGSLSVEKWGYSSGTTWKVSV